ncbi:cell division protein ZipA [Marinibactrum halimedae]|uniref:Cell division protein ZipA n=1 Tax=Marinibactrum halimedae TaxID=1444977 RepID=A0AA37T592_9GAMM|nr:cell division protein ZipA [Marinibactrum halimedae]MCD9459415.1 cell division protein ZipA [Marinibactrum halimedae]GLS27518.1 cell division protein ZipA [Marinibactrum halimedae]
MREWLTIIIILLILVVVLDGLRRMRQARRAEIKMSRSVHNQQHDEKPSEAGGKPFGSELPSGGARVVEQRDGTEAEKLNQSIKAAYSASRTTSSYRIPEQVTLNLEESVPMLMDSVAESQGGRTEPTLDDAKVGEPLAEETFLAAGADVSVVTPDLDSTLTNSEPENAHSSISHPSTSQVAQEEFTDPDEVLVINVMAPKGTFFEGPALLDVVLECGMRFGDMSIFHRHQDVEGKGPMLFSMANIVMPGTFNLPEIGSFKTPGVSLFLALPVPGKSLEAFELMYDSAQLLVSELGGELKDENRSVMTQQTVEHYRQRIVDYERKRRLSKT